MFYDTIILFYCTPLVYEYKTYIYIYIYKENASTVQCVSVFLMTNYYINNDSNMYMCMFDA